MNREDECSKPHPPPRESVDRLRVLRILDAAANRAGEGLRVVEDFLRFALDDRHLTQLAKTLRHELADALAALPSAARHAARDTLADVGTSLATPGELARPDLTSVAQAALKRTEQSLRSLEEYAKLLDPALAARFESLRYRMYTLERAAEMTQTSIERLAEARLQVLIDGGSSENEFQWQVTALISGGANILQLRDKRLDDRTLLARARLLTKLTRETSTLTIINDRPDVAVLAEADGVHVGQDELAVKDARAIVGPERLVGLSTHSLAQARAGVLAGANYLGVGPMFPSATKTFSDFPGLNFARQVADEIRLPAFAIGGITLENLEELLKVGVTRVAVGSAIVAAPDPAAAARRFAQRLAPRRSQGMPS